MLSHRNRVELPRKPTSTERSHVSAQISQRTMNMGDVTRRRLSVLGTAAAVLVAGCSTGKQDSASREASAGENVAQVAQAITITDGTYEIKSAVSGAGCLDVRDWSTVDNALVQQWACNS